MMNESQDNDYTFINSRELDTINEGLEECMRLIDPKYPFYTSEYFIDFQVLAMWIRAHLQTGDGEAS